MREREREGEKGKGNVPQHCNAHIKRKKLIDATKEDTNCLQSTNK